MRVSLKFQDPHGDKLSKASRFRMKSGILKNKEFGGHDCRCKNGIDKFVIPVQCLACFLRIS